jgi:hypothetical protein
MAAPVVMAAVPAIPAVPNVGTAAFATGLGAVRQALEPIMNKNILLNRCDPSKDAGDTNDLDRTAHAPRVRAAINLAFPPDDGEPGGGQAPVIGDTKPYMMRILQPDIDQASQNKQEITRLKLSPSGHNNSVLANKIIAHDAGLGPSGLFGEDYTLIITPGSILDPATKIRARGRDIIDYIRRNATLPAALLGYIGMGTALRAPAAAAAPSPPPIIFNYVGGANPYQFTIYVMGEQVEVQFDAQFRAQGASANYFAGNPTKNAFIAANAALDEITKYIVIKNIGDALQVIWLLYIVMMADSANKNRYAMMSCDKVVWLRCLVNNLSIFLTSGNKATYYGSMSAEDFAEEIRRGLRNDVLAKNNGVIDTLRLLLLSNNATLNGTAIPAAAAPDAAVPARRQGFGTLVDRLVNSLTSTNTAIRTYLEDPATQALPLVDFRAAVKKLSMVCPVIRKGTDFKLNPEFKAAFLPNNTNLPGPIPGIYAPPADPAADPAAAAAAVRRATLPFAKIHLYSAISRTINAGTVGNMCIDLPPPVQVGGVYPDDWVAGRPLAAQPPPNVPNPLPYNPENWDYIHALLAQADNHGKPGFIAYILVTYFPEILHIGYIHALDAAGGRTNDMTILVSVNSIVEALTDSFTSLDATSRFTTEVTSPALLATFTALDTAARQLATYALPVIRYIFPPTAVPAPANVNQYIYICETIPQIPLLVVGPAPAVAPAAAPPDYGEIYGIYNSIYNDMLMASYTNGYVPGYNPHLQIYNVPLRASHHERVAARDSINAVINDLIINITGPNPSAADVEAASIIVGGPITADETRVIAELGVNNARFNAAEVAETERRDAVMVQARELVEAIAAEAAAAEAAAAFAAAPYGGAAGADPLLAVPVLAPAAAFAAAPYGGAAAGADPLLAVPVLAPAAAFAAAQLAAYGAAAGGDGDEGDSNVEYVGSKAAPGAGGGAPEVEFRWQLPPPGKLAALLRAGRGETAAAGAPVATRITGTVGSGQILGNGTIVIDSDDEEVDAGAAGSPGGRAAPPPDRKTRPRFMTVHNFSTGDGAAGGGGGGGGGAGGGRVSISGSTATLVLNPAAVGNTSGTRKRKRDNLGNASAGHKLGGNMTRMKLAPTKAAAEAAARRFSGSSGSGAGFGGGGGAGFGGAGFGGAASGGAPAAAGSGGGGAAGSAGSNSNSHRGKRSRLAEEQGGGARRTRRNQKTHRRYNKTRKANAAGAARRRRTIRRSK